MCAILPTVQTGFVSHLIVKSPKDETVLNPHKFFTQIPANIMYGTVEVIAFTI